MVSYFDAEPLPLPEDVEASWNISPGTDVRVVVERVATDGAGNQAGNLTRQLRCARWGLLASWATQARQAFRAFNARSETAASKPTFRESFRSFRAVVPADCWYEWHRPTGAGGREEGSRWRWPGCARGGVCPPPTRRCDPDPASMTTAAGPGC